MAAGDTALWLHNKLGSTDDLWSGKSICSQLSHEKLVSIQECFHALQSHVKVKLLVSFLHIPRRNLEQWQADLEEVILLGINDPDPWVATIGEVMREFPSNGSLLLVEQDNRADSVMLVCLDEMKTLAENSAIQMMPLECQYLNRASLAAAAGSMPEPAKHFTVKRKPKSAALRAEIVQKSSETLLNKRNHASSSLPIKSRSFAKKLDMTPLKMPPSRSLSSSDYRSPNMSRLGIGSPLGRSPMTPMHLTPRHSSTKKDSKIKLLEIEEMPVGAKEAKRRKKVAELAQESQRKEREAAAAAAAAEAAANDTTPAAAGATSTAASYTPDYAAGLVAPAAPKMPMAVLSATSSTLSQPTSTYLPASARQNAPAMTLSGLGILSVAAQSPASTKQPTPNYSQQLKQQLLKAPSPLQSGASASSSPIITTNPTSVVLQPAPQLQPTAQLRAAGGIKQTIPGLLQPTAGSAMPLSATSLPVGATTLSLAMVRPSSVTQTVFVPAQGNVTAPLVRPQQLVTLRPAAPTLVSQTAGTAQQAVAALPAGVTRLGGPVGGQMAQPIAPAATPTATTQPAKKGLSLTKEQMNEAQEMFKVSNKVSRPEKALILGFMAGSRENPCPKQGPVLNIRLSERELVAQLPDGTQKKAIEDTYFQMNYDTGEWKRFNKIRDALIS